MKQKLFFLLIAIFACSANTFATKHTITVADFSFSPSSLTIQMGDTILWSWVSGSHTTTSVTIPSGAASWNTPINSSSTSFTYVPTVAGTYNYQCNFHASMGMTGSFTVEALNVNTVNTPLAISIYPNPASSILNIEIPGNNRQTIVTISDISGKMLFNNTSTAQKIQINTSSFANGLYFIHIANDDNTQIQKLEINH